MLCYASLRRRSRVDAMLCFASAAVFLVSAFDYRRLFCQWRRRIILGNTRTRRMRTRVVVGIAGWGRCWWWSYFIDEDKRSWQRRRARWWWWWWLMSQSLVSWDNPSASVSVDNQARLTVIDDQNFRWPRLRRGSTTTITIELLYCIDINRHYRR